MEYSVKHCVSQIDLYVRAFTAMAKQEYSSEILSLSPIFNSMIHILYLYYDSYQSTDKQQQMTFKIQLVNVISILISDC